MMRTPPINPVMAGEDPPPTTLFRAHAFSRGWRACARHDEGTARTGDHQTHA